MPDATSLHHCLENKQLKLNAFSVKDPAKAVFNICTLMRGVQHTHAAGKVVHLLYRKEMALPYNCSFAWLVACLLMSYA